MIRHSGSPALRGPRDTPRLSFCFAAILGLCGPGGLVGVTSAQEPETTGNYGTFGYVGGGFGGVGSSCNSCQQCETCQTHHWPPKLQHCMEGEPKIHVKIGCPKPICNPLLAAELGLLREVLEPVAVPAELDALPEPAAGRHRGPDRARLRRIDPVLRQRSAAAAAADDYDARGTYVCPADAGPAADADPCRRCRPSRRCGRRRCRLRRRCRRTRSPAAPAARSNRCRSRARARRRCGRRRAISTTSEPTRAARPTSSTTRGDDPIASRRRIMGPGRRAVRRKPPVR